MKGQRSILRNKGVQSLLASLLCIVVGLLVGYLVLLIINPAGAWEAITTIVKNFFYYPSPQAQLRYFGNTLVKTAPRPGTCPGSCACWPPWRQGPCWGPSPAL